MAATHVAAMFFKPDGNLIPLHRSVSVVPSGAYGPSRKIPEWLLNTMMFVKKYILQTISHPG
jgi:hypothetical protein